MGIDVAALEEGRPVCRHCLDWSERRAHLGGALGAAVLMTHAFERRWARREAGRAVAFTPTGGRAFAAAFGLDG